MDLILEGGSQNSADWWVNVGIQDDIDHQPPPAASNFAMASVKKFVELKGSPKRLPFILCLNLSTTFVVLTPLQIKI